MGELFEGATSRDPLDFNRTPAWVAELLIPELGQPATILDAGCGDGAIGKVLRQAFTTARIWGVELNIQRAALADQSRIYNKVGGFDWCADLEEWRHPDNAPFDLIISNPPFGLAALDFLRCALARVRPGGTVAFLLPTHWDHDPEIGRAHV